MSVAHHLHHHFLVKDSCSDERERRASNEFREQNIDTSLPHCGLIDQQFNSTVSQNDAPMKLWLLKCMKFQQQHDSHKQAPINDEEWPTAYDRLTETGEEICKTTSDYSLDVARVAAAAALACPKLQTVPMSSTCAYKPPSHNEIKSETLTAIGSSLSRCSTDISIADSNTPFSGHLSYERRSYTRIQRTCEFVLQFISNHLRAITTVVMIILLIVLLVYLQPIIVSYYQTHDNVQSLFIGMSSPVIAEYQSSLLPGRRHSLYRISPSVPPHHGPNLAEVPTSLVEPLDNHNLSQSRLKTTPPRSAHDQDDHDQKFLDSQSGPDSLTHSNANLSETVQRTHETDFAYWDLVLAALLFSYILCGYAIQNLRFIYFHESVVSVTLGIVVGLLFVDTAGTFRFGMMWYTTH